MAVTVDELFERDLNDIINVAKELLKDNDPDTKEFVTQNITDLQKFLQRKQTEAERQLQNEIDEDNKEIQSMEYRIDKLRKGGVEDPGEETLDHVKIWRDLKDNGWKEVFRLFIQETRDPVQLIHERLINILKKAYKTAGANMRDSRAQILYQVIQPGADWHKTVERQRAVKAFEKREEEINELSAQCQIKAMPFCIESIKQNIKEAILNKDPKLCAVPSASDAVKKAMENYFLKCIEFSWVASFEETPPVLLVSDPKECPKKLHSSFEGFDKVPKQCTVEWPALVQGDSIICPWVLYERNQLRPKFPPFTKEVLLNVAPQSTKQGRHVAESGAMSQSRAEVTSPISRGSPLLQPPDNPKSTNSEEGPTKLQQKSIGTAPNMPSTKPKKIHANMRNKPNTEF